jgi:hypothetical protein
MTPTITATTGERYVTVLAIELALAARTRKFHMKAKPLLTTPSPHLTKSTPKGDRKPRECLMKRNEHPEVIPVAI